MQTKSIKNLAMLTVAITTLVLISGSVSSALAASNNGNGNGNESITFCHMNGSSIGNTITISQSAANAHFAGDDGKGHDGDHYGACTAAELSDVDADGIRDDADACPTDPTNTCNNPEDTTAPEITVSEVCSLAGNLGWCRGDVTVQWTVLDSQSSITSKSGCETTVTSSDVQGKILTCSATSQGGTSTLSVVVNRDATAPVTSSGVQSPAANQNGWNNSEVSVEFTCSDALSGAVTESITESVTSEGANQSASAQCEDMAGNTSSATHNGINIDMSEPVTSSGVQSPAANENGWNNSEVSVEFTCSDALSGAVTESVTSSVITEGTNQSATGQCEDMAGNTSSATYNGINIDLTAPTFNIPVSSTGLVYVLAQPATISCQDELSGIASCDGTLPTTKAGANSQVVSAVDLAGNVSTPAISYQVNYDLACGVGNGQFMSPVPNTQYKSGRVVPEKFIACDYYKIPVSNVVATSFVDSTPASSPGAANNDNLFRYDSVAMQYIFNMNSKGIALGDHTLSAQLDSGQVISSIVKFTK
jgi:hypothetical protein